MSLGCPVQMVLCRNPECAMSFPLNHGLGGTTRPLEGLPDPFEATCPGYGQMHRYPKSGVQTSK
jgi:hypothetical protein